MHGHTFTYAYDASQAHFECLVIVTGLKQLLCHSVDASGVKKHVGAKISAEEIVLYETAPEY